MISFDDPTKVWVMSSIVGVADKATHSRPVRCDAATLPEAPAYYSLGGPWREMTADDAKAYRAFVAARVVRRPRLVLKSRPAPGPRDDQPTLAGLDE